MDISILQRHLSNKEREKLISIQKDLHGQFMKGGAVIYQNENFDFLPSVFMPRPDSVALVKNMKIQSGDKVLDVCCGSGVIGIMAMKRGAAFCLGLDINPEAVRCAKQNARKHNFKNYDARVSDVLSALNVDEIFNIVTFNPPFVDLPASRIVERTTWDEGLEVQRMFFSGISKYLAPGGKIYFAQANFGELGKIQILLDEWGWEAELLGRQPFEVVPGMEFYAFQITRR